VVLVGEQGEVQRLAAVELLDRRDGVGRDAEDGRAGGLVVGRVVADPAGLRRAAGRVGLGVEVEDDRAAAQLAQPDPLAVLVGKLEVRRAVPGLDQGWACSIC
jgi:hypothetical protein